MHSFSCSHIGCSYWCGSVAQPTAHPPSLTHPPTPQHDGKWDYTKGQSVSKTNFETLALKLPKDILKSGGHGWCVSATGERSGIAKLHTKKSDWKYQPPQPKGVFNMW